MSAERKYPYAIVATKNPFYCRSSHFRRKVEFKDLNHARNYCKKIAKPDWFQMPDGSWKNLNYVSKITVWVAEGKCHIWVKGKGWTQ